MSSNSSGSSVAAAPVVVAARTSSVEHTSSSAPFLRYTAVVWQHLVLWFDLLLRALLKPPAVSNELSMCCCTLRRVARCTHTQTHGVSTGCFMRKGENIVLQQYTACHVLH
jgi:hypothetical protein